MVSIVHNVNERYMTTIRLHMYSSISNRFSITQKSILSHSKYIERRKDAQTFSESLPATGKKAMTAWLESNSL